jgi:acyl-CoA synthetase (AMP-forming)/AMP-acid ligase II
MNCASRVIPHLSSRANRMAVWTARDGILTFAELGRMMASAQALARDDGLKVGDTALILDTPGPRLYAGILGMMGLGVAVVFVEPWLPVADIERVIARVAPRVFYGSLLARLWGARLKEVRRIPRWRSIRAIGKRAALEAFVAADVDAETPGVITFTSGTTGTPKGIVRSHRYLAVTQDILTQGGTREQFDAPDLCIFPNLTLLHVGTGRGAVLVPADWNVGALARINELPSVLQPQSVSCGPAFLRLLSRQATRTPMMRALKSINVGGAQTDCAIMERGMELWPDADWTHVYGGTEVEPVAFGDARESVKRSRDRGLFQMLHLGRPIPELRTANSSKGMWVSGPNVAPMYLDDHPDNATMKRVDADGTLWHNTGDRIETVTDGWWYGGRASQDPDEFELEQNVYARLGTSASFVRRARDGRLILYGERVATGATSKGFRAKFPEIGEVKVAAIKRDRRHRARIDRKATLKAAGYLDD